VIPAAAVFDHLEEFSAGLDALLFGRQERLRELKRRSAPETTVDSQAPQVKQLSSCSSHGL
jgi:hypothetical protein